MTSQKDFYICANLLIKRHGKDAENHALQRSEEFAEKGEMLGAGTWLAIAQAVRELENQKAPTRLH